MSTLPLEIGDSLEIEKQLLPWYGVRTKPKHERVVAQYLDNKGYEQYCPAYTVTRKWSDRVVKSEIPLFPGYIFCRLEVKRRLPVLTIPGVLSFVAFGGEPVPIPDEEVDAARRVLLSGRPVQPCAFLCEGQRVRVKRGALEGVKGILLKNKSDLRLVVSVTMLQRSIAVELDRDWIEAIAPGS